MTATFILSIIGSITGVSGLLIQFSNYLMAKPKINVSTPAFYTNWVFKCGNEEEWGYITEKSQYENKFNRVRFIEKDDYYVFVIQLSISNKSSSPITINRIFSTNENIYSINKYHFKLVNQLDENNFYNVNQLEKADFPIRIKPFDSAEVSVALYSKNTNVRTDMLKIKISSPARQKRYTVTDFERYDEMMIRRQNEL